MLSDIFKEKLSTNDGVEKRPDPKAAYDTDTGYFITIHISIRNI